MADRSPICTKTQIVSVWTLAREPCSPVPRSGLIIPFSVVFFHLRHLLRLFEPRLATIEKTDLGKIFTLKVVVDRLERIDEPFAESSSTIDDNCRGLGKPSFPRSQFAVRYVVRQGRVSLSQSPSIAVDLIQERGFEQKHRAIEKGPSSARFAGDEVAIGAAQRDNGKDLQVLPDRAWAAVDLEDPAKWWPGHRTLEETQHPCRGFDTTLEGELELTVGHQSTHGRHSERTQIPENGHGLEEIGLTLSVRAGHEVADRTPRNPGGPKIAKASGSDLDEMHC